MVSLNASSHEQLFRPFYASSAWHSQQTRSGSQNVSAFVLSILDVDLHSHIPKALGFYYISNNKQLNSESLTDVIESYSICRWLLSLTAKSFFQECVNIFIVDEVIIYVVQQSTTLVSINLLTVKHASCILIGYSTRGLFVIAYQQRKDKKAYQNSNEPRFAIISENFIDILICTFFLTDQQVYTKTIRPLGLMDYELNSPFGLRPYGLLTRSPFVLEV